MFTTMMITARQDGTKLNVMRINHIPYYENTYAPTNTSPDALGNEPDCLLTDKKAINHLLKMLRSHKAKAPFQAQFIRSIFQYDGSIIYVDSAGTVLYPDGQYYYVNSKKLERLLNQNGCGENVSTHPLPGRIVFNPQTSRNRADSPQ